MIKTYWKVKTYLDTVHNNYLINLNYNKLWDLIKIVWYLIDDFRRINEVDYAETGMTKFRLFLTIFE